LLFGGKRKRPKGHERKIDRDAEPGEQMTERKATRVLVTGSSRGIGRAVALELGRAGFQISLHYHSNEAAAREAHEQLREICPDAAEPLRFDVGDRDGCRAVLQAEVEKRGAFWGVVCNAGVLRDGPFVGFSDDDWDSVLGTNLDSFYNVLHPLVMPMIQLRSGGRIVTMSSLSGITGNRGQVNYSAAKAGLIGATKALSKELAKRAITVNCVAPGFIESEMTDHPGLEQMLESIPMRRAGKPEEVASAVSFLFSGGASYITGPVLSVNGGLL
jgi:3-oxoacyl-[acyl-carrier protein] reductase